MRCVSICFVFAAAVVAFVLAGPSESVVATTDCTNGCKTADPASSPGSRPALGIPTVAIVVTEPTLLSLAGIALTVVASRRRRIDREGKSG